ncbi:MAG: pyruvate kinase, partial [Actinobacteria bacterium]
MTRRVKLVATLGPASSSPAVLDALVSTGLDVARLNASHAGPEGLEPLLDGVRAAAQRAGRHVAVMLDLSGPKIRIGPMAEGVVLKEGAVFELRGGEECAGDATRACVTHAGLANDVRTGDAVLLDDGRVRLRVEDVKGPSVFTRVEVGGPLKARKGVNVAGRTLSVDGVTPKDLDDLAWGLDVGVDLVAQSFVRSAADVERLRAAMGERAVPIVAKVEKHEALAALPEIVDAADAVMVARGDLGAETSPERVPVIQRGLVRMAREAGRPVIVATEMLQSMLTADRPTRAEASDVATAVFQRADAVMLSGETAVGAHPIEALAAAARIAEAAEEAAEGGMPLPEPGGHWDVTLAVSDAVCEL